MENKKFISVLYQIGAIQFGNFVLKNGQTSPIYLNLRKIISYPDFLTSIASIMMQKMIGKQVDLVCGVPYTALPIATCISLDYKIPMIMRRKEKKEHGTKQLVEGVYTKGQQCLVVEDVVTSGSSILETTHDLEQVGVRVKDVIALIDRQQGGRENIEKKYRFYALTTLSEILEQLQNSQDLPDSEKQIIRQLLQKG